MSTSGFSKARLHRMQDNLERHVESGFAPGVVTLVARGTEIHVDVIGAQAFGGAPMQRDTLFRISSMTKPVTAVATMILVEECVLRLDEPVDTFLPELANRTVLRAPDAPLHDTVPAKRAITLRDLLTFRAGYGFYFGPSVHESVTKAIDALELKFGAPKPRTPHTPDEWMRRLGTLPLVHQPGEQWRYGTGSELLAVLVARASGKSFEDFLRERIFEPLGMKDTFFTVPAEERHRLATSYWALSADKPVAIYDSVEDSQWNTPPPFPSGSAGLVSTADDFFAFARMLMNGGKDGNTSILSRASVETMTTDQLTPEQKALSPFAGLWDDHGWGFGVSIATKRTDLYKIPGRYGWDGGLGTAWANDPKERMVGIMLSQRAGFPSQNPLYLDFWTSAYQAIED
ncbi:Beta-lactamase class C and other penicillin binding protein [Labilithrix luteola]|uniref:Beta-lactamase class C and other penicillin binding protein n=1 Tax=Labilithrix luteola TaxID=1391654 RepID=A0A0K1PM82_9BACT|nr:serine hydrolase domain-containing protein [Labilithrix luteola]AKU94648.1 Beta-lactamase class C and other penicillin binding protein [Labilithrix luteola]